ncbi:hypothetical protein FE257_012178 [Aspergillus nanangensis]|uniref:O-methyltransferase domain-containing protein n=1 Tax=Aspergillus nanangensis TaxID=2582783 RepID=A0AAD4GQZ2_ASPNN|nr:hypothetical protein FE257_012178 [Aspergillus nanangensis]
MESASILCHDSRSNPAKHPIATTADRDQLKQLATDIQDAVASYDPTELGTHDQIQQAMEKLRRAIQPPAPFTRHTQSKLVENFSVHVAIKMGLLQALAKRPDKSMTSSDLSKSTGYDVSFTARIMRMVAALGFVDETGYQTYVANANTMYQSNELANRALLFGGEAMYRIANRLGEYIDKCKPCNLEEIPPLWDYALGETIWETMKTDTELKTNFDCSMTMNNTAFGVPWHVKYGGISDQLSRSSKPVIVDIGGNQGVDLQRFASDLPDLECELILEDLPETLAKFPATVDKRIRPLEYNFFTEQPVKGANIYYLRRVLHDWPDKSARQILSNTAVVMNAQSRLLIGEIVMRDTNESSDNIGLDLRMMFLLNGKQRTKTEWEELLATVTPPLEILKIWTASGDRLSVIETGLRDG